MRHIGLRLSSDLFAKSKGLSSSLINSVGGAPRLPRKARDPLCVKESKLEGLRASL